jgi:alpha-glucosidase
MPVQRSLAIDYTHQPLIYDGQYQHQYLFGPNILVAPVESFKELTKIFLPAGEWYYLYTGKKYEGDQEIMLACPIHKLPVFIKAGAVLPMQKVVMSTAEKTDELILHVYTGKASSEFSFYADDGETFLYQRNEFASRKIRYAPEENKLTVAKTEGSWAEQFSKLKFIFHGLVANGITVNGEQKALTHFNHSYFSPLEKYDPINDPDSMGEELVQAVELSYTRNPIEVTW